MRLETALDLSRLDQAGRYDSFKKRFHLACREKGQVYFYRTNKKGKNLSYWHPGIKDPYRYTDWLPISPKEIE